MFPQTLRDKTPVHRMASVDGRQSASVVARVRELAPPLNRLSRERILEQVERLRSLIAREGVDNQEATVRAFALMVEAIHRTVNVTLYDVQLLAATVLAAGGVAEMQTGEGKTLACAPAALLHGLTGRGVHIATPNAYLAERDCASLQLAFRWLGVSVGLVREGANNDEKRQAYRCDITYGTGHEFGFDYLRDQLTLRATKRQPLGKEILQALAGEARAAENLTQRGHCFCIVDEADNVLLDDATSPLILSDAEETARDAEVHRAAWQAIRELRDGEHFHHHSASGEIRLTDAGVEHTHSANQPPIQLLRRTWMEYLHQALQARQLKRDRHYVIDDQGKVQIVDANTGRIFTDRSWQDGLHQAVEAKEGLTITGEKRALLQITRQRFFRLYERLAGTTGTAGGCARELQHVYQMGVHPVPLRTPSRREIWPPRFFISQGVKRAAIALSTAELFRDGRPVLVGTRSIAQSELLAEVFELRNIPFQMLNGRQDAEEAAVVATAGQLGAVTIATGLAGRGTDIRLGRGVAERGGLHVVMDECNESARIDRQLIGRCARQGDPGSAQTFVSAEDALVGRFGSWLAASIRRHADTDGECRIDLMAQIGRIQRSAERWHGARRADLLRRDLSRDSLHSRQPLDS